MKYLFGVKLYFRSTPVPSLDTTGHVTPDIEGPRGALLPPHPSPSSAIRCTVLPSPISRCRDALTQVQGCPYPQGAGKPSLTRCRGALTHQVQGCSHPPGAGVPSLRCRDALSKDNVTYRKLLSGISRQTSIFNLLQTA